MHTRSQSIALLALTGASLILALTGCAPEAPNPTAESTAPVEQAQPANGEQAFLDRLSTGELGVTVIEVIDPRTVVVGPTEISKKNEGFLGTHTVRFGPSSTLVTPAKGECGYDETLAFATQFFADKPDEAYVFEGSFRSDTYVPGLIEEGFAYIPNNEGQFTILQENAQLHKRGLWGSCADFGA